MKHLILDFETMGQDPTNCAVIDCALFVLDTEKALSDNPYTIYDLQNIHRLKLDVQDQIKEYGFIIEKKTIEFWKNLDESIRKRIQRSEKDLSVEEFVNSFVDILISNGKIDYWWSRSNTFDPIILRRLFVNADKEAHLNEHLKFWRVRDLRTFYDAKLDFPKKNGFCPVSNEEKWNKIFQEHNSSWDVLADVLRFQAVLRAESDKEQYEI